MKRGYKPQCERCCPCILNISVLKVYNRLGTTRKIAKNSGIIVPRWKKRLPFWNGGGLRPAFAGIYAAVALPVDSVVRYAASEWLPVDFSVFMIIGPVFKEIFHKNSQGFRDTKSRSDGGLKLDHCRFTNSVNFSPSYRLLRLIDIMLPKP